MANFRAETWSKRDKILDQKRDQNLEQNEVKILTNFGSETIKTGSGINVLESRSKNRGTGIKFLESRFQNRGSGIDVLESRLQESRSSWFNILRFTVTYPNHQTSLSPKLPFYSFLSGASFSKSFPSKFLSNSFPFAAFSLNPSAPISRPSPSPNCSLCLP